MKRIKEKPQKQVRTDSSVFKLAVCCILLFVGLLCFFIKIHPVLLFDSDDWYYLGIYRKPVPMWGAQNPIKAFPEYILPLSNKLASLCIYPLVQNVFTAVSIKDGMLLSFAVTVYISLFTRLVFWLTKKNVLSTVSLSALFLILHFVLFRSAASDNVYLFYSLDQTNYYHYLIPALMNCSIALYLMREDILTDFFTKGKFLEKLLFLVISYFSIFSNLTACIISAVYVGSSLLIEFMNRGQEKLIVFLKRRIMKLVYLVTWAVAQWYEMNGNRAAQLSEDAAFTDRFKESIQGFGNLLKTLNPMAAVVLAGIGLIFIIFAVRSAIAAKSEHKQEIMQSIKKESLPETGPILLAAVLSAGFNYLYMLLLCSKAGSWYITRVDATFGIFSYLLLVFMLLLAIFLIQRPNTAWAVLAAAAVLAIPFRTEGKVFQDSNRLNADAALIREINDDSFAQIMAAYESGERSMELLVPKFDTGDNWPIATYSGSFYIYGLHNMGLVDHYVEITVVPTQEKNLQFGL